ncbi:helix-turn-helix domain-containing protein [Halomonas heilongjiangensis]|uniref:HTH araC/xylS-type domain-containing protein n=1 Tax=Halomonas heilongjiangensis TaxID=1387883 RepID=A0A2N7TVG3_9GAMM|nr:helix-turn-helix domain-containing protein [Halomonas heilongjiangensis]PMR72155.1 hypothetical protein C1H66_00445 [Halomonas heilongjiangensis]PXX91406.1 hypothetical protein CR158_07805 [Halomonas heilongjiangensis]
MQRGGARLPGPAPPASSAARFEDQVEGRFGRVAPAHRRRQAPARATEASVEEISWRVGYEDSAFIRRLFKRTTGLNPSAYRRRFRIPDFARSSH